MGLSLAVLIFAAAAPLSSDDCLGCHADKDLKNAHGAAVFVDAARQAKSVHDGVDCASCHEGIAAYPHPDPVPAASCASCHEDAVRAQAASVHATAKGPDHPTCASCHGHGHDVLKAADPASPVSKPRVAATCAVCHADPSFLARHRLPLARPVEAYERSVHARARRAGDQAAATCSDCHGAHDIASARDAGASVNHAHVPATCGKCHAEIAKTYAQSVHGQAAARGEAESPVCTDCHGEHAILAPGEADSLVNPARVSSVTCGRCHADERLTAKYNLPRDRVPAFEDSYHGLALRAGSQSVANCASCHGVHNILASSDARSTIHPANLGDTCGSCHPGAGERFAIGAVHVTPGGASEHTVVRLLRQAYVVIILFTVGFMLLHNGLDFGRKLLRGADHGAGTGGQVPRMNRLFRIAHGLVVVSFTVLVVTGFALKFPSAWWASPLLAWEGQVAFRGLVHRAAGVVLMAALLFHAVHLAVSPRSRAILRDLWLRPRDLRDLVAMVRHNLGRGPRPLFGHFSYAEKVEYWAFMWGTVVMAVTGLLLWFNSWTLRQFPTWVADAATVVHYYEAILASLSILVWHLYMVVFDPDVYPMDPAWLTGKTSADHFRRTRSADAVHSKEESDETR
jgi:cytochrome b subunit of formate dehydrogenase/nitrate/TMAO reductase-like tetraheme cytochrome c subunit